MQGEENSYPHLTDQHAAWLSRGRAGIVAESLVPYLLTLSLCPAPHPPGTCARDTLCHLSPHRGPQCSSGQALPPPTSHRHMAQTQKYGHVHLPPVIRIIVLIYVFLAIDIFQNIASVFLKIGSINIIQ